MEQTSPIILLLSNTENSGLDQYAKIYHESFPQSDYVRMADHFAIRKGFQYKLFLTLLFNKKSAYTVRLLELLKEKNAKNLHICDNPIFSYFLLKELLKNDFQIIFTLHDPKTHSEANLIKKVVSKIEEYYFQKIFILSKNNPSKLLIHIHSQNIIPSNFPKIQFIELPHPLYQLKNLTISSHETSNLSKMHFCYLGRIEYYKGIDLIIDAMKIIDRRDEYNELIKFTIAGKGRFKIELPDYKKIEFNYLNRYLTSQEFKSLLQNSDFLLLPYRDVSQSGIFSQALTNNIPVICNDIGYLGETVKNFTLGYAMQSCTPQALADCIIKAYEEKNKYKLLTANIYKFSNELSPDKISKQLYAHYNSY